MKDALSRLLYVIHWIVYILFVGSWIIILVWGLNELSPGPNDRGFDRVVISLWIALTSYEQNFWFPLITYILPIAMIFVDWIINGKIIFIPWNRKWPPPNTSD